MRDDASDWKTPIGKRPWSPPQIIRSAEAIDSAKTTTTSEHYVNPGYAFPRTVGPMS